MLAASCKDTSTICSFINMVTSMQLVDVIDILIVSYIIYQIIRLIRGTRALQMLIGLLVITSLYFISDRLNLLTLHWLLKTFLSSILLIIIIVFQSDIRRALTQFGKSPFYKKKHIADDDLEEITKAAKYMAGKRIGALIVIEQRNGLKDYVETGFTLNANLIQELLIAIFIPSSPMHDGGVIIKEGKIQSASCLLPLSSNALISKRYGTRHRAALGLSEETDAIIIVVSEETQEISLVHKGEITSLKNHDDLDKTLKTKFISPTPNNPRWKNWLKAKK